MDSLDSALKHYDEVSITSQHIKETCNLSMCFFVNLSKTLCILFTCQPDQTQSSSYILGVDIGTTSVKVFDDSRKKKYVRHCFMILSCSVMFRSNVLLLHFSRVLGFSSRAESAKSMFCLIWIWTPNFASAGLSPRLKDSRHALLLC